MCFLFITVLRKPRFLVVSHSRDLLAHYLLDAEDFHNALAAVCAISEDFDNWCPFSAVAS